MTSTQSSTTTGPVSVSCETGLLSNKLPGSSLDFDLYDPGHSIDSLFGQAHTGAALLESILAWYLDSEQDVPWFADGGGEVRSVVRSLTTLTGSDSESLRGPHPRRGLVPDRCRTGRSEHVGAQHMPVTCTHDSHDTCVTR